MPSNNAFTFTAEIYTVGVNRCVDVPPRISRTMGDPKHLPVRGHVNGIPISTTLTPRGDGLYRLFIHSRIWQRLGVDTGDTIEVTIQRDRASREPELPADIEVALANDTTARAAYESMTSAGRRALVRWIDETKTADTRQRRIGQAMERMIENTARKRQH